MGELHDEEGDGDGEGAEEPVDAVKGFLGHEVEELVEGYSDEGGHEVPANYREGEGKLK